MRRAGIGFAIPSSTVTDIAGQLVSNGKVTNSHRAYLGVRVGDTTGGKGVLVGSVTAGGPAATAGIVAGETIVSVDGQKTATTVRPRDRPGRPQARAEGVDRARSARTART